MLAEYAGFFSRAGLGEFGFRWLHILAGITWIGLLYFFNFVQVPEYAKFENEPHKEIGGKARLIAIDKVTRKALWWFRWAALGTFLTGILITGAVKDYFKNTPIYSEPDETTGAVTVIGEISWGRFGGNIGISAGILLGTIMMLNVWGVIWRNQKVVLANAANVLAGGEANPDAPAAGRRAVMASRQNLVFSVAMLFFMVFKSHHPYSANELTSGELGLFWGITMVLIIILELNCLGLLPWKTAPNKGLNKLYDGPGVRNPLIAAFGFFAVMLVLTEVLFKA